MVKKTRQGRGIGKRLFQRLDEWAIAQSMHRIDLQVLTGCGKIHGEPRLSG